MKRLVIIADCHSNDQQYFEQLESDSTQVKYIADSIQNANLDEIKNAEVIAVHVSSKLDAQLLKSLTKLKLIICRSTGYDNVDLQQAKKQKIVVANIPAYGEATVAEYAALLMLALNRKLIASVEMAESGEIEPAELIGTDLQGKTLGVVATGRIGRHLIGIAKGFGMKVLAFDPFPNADAAKKLGFEYVELDQLWRESDIISLHAPATDENKHLVSTEVFEKMKPSAVLINTARGSLVDTDALVRALSDEQIAGAALDVVEGEELLGLEAELHLLQGSSAKLDFKVGMNLDALQKLPNVIITTHNAYNTREALGRIQEATLTNIKLYFDGRAKEIKAVN
jgi:D-lactate dehydrogenase